MKRNILDVLIEILRGIVQAFFLLVILIIIWQPFAATMNDIIAYSWLVMITPAFWLALVMVGFMLGFTKLLASIIISKPFSKAKSEEYS